MKNKHYRWPVKYKDKIFMDRLHLFEYLCTYTIHKFNLNAFPHSRNYYIRWLLEEKFQRSFSEQEVKKIIKDKSWQSTSHPSNTNLKK